MVTFGCSIISNESGMIKSWKHKGLKHFFEEGSIRGIQAAQAEKIAKRLFVINRAKTINEIALPAFKLHQLKGDREGIWSIHVTGNWRITFAFKNGDAYILDYEDYH